MIASGAHDRYIMNHPLYPWVDPRNRPTTTWAVCLVSVAAGWLVGYGVLFPPLARFASSALRFCLSPGIRLSMRRGASGENAWRFDSGRGAGTFFFFYFFVFCFSSFFNLFLSTPSRIQCGILQEIRNSMTESEEIAGERERDRRGREKWQ